MIGMRVITTHEGEHVLGTVLRSKRNYLLEIRLDSGAVVLRWIGSVMVP